MASRNTVRRFLAGLGALVAGTFYLSPAVSANDFYGILPPPNVVQEITAINNATTTCLAQKFLSFQKFGNPHISLNFIGTASQQQTSAIAQTAAPRHRRFRFDRQLNSARLEASHMGFVLLSLEDPVNRRYDDLVADLDRQLHPLGVNKSAKTAHISLGRVNKNPGKDALQNALDHCAINLGNLAGQQFLVNEFHLLHSANGIRKVATFELGQIPKLPQNGPTGGDPTITPMSPTNGSNPPSQPTQPSSPPASDQRNPPSIQATLTVKHSKYTLNLTLKPPWSRVADDVSLVVRSGKTVLSRQTVQLLSSNVQVRVPVKKRQLRRAYTVHISYSGADGQRLTITKNIRPKRTGRR